MPEEIIIENCSPTLAGIKTGNMFSVERTDKMNVICEVRELNQMLQQKGLRVIPLRITKAHVLMYIYRPDRLQRDLQDPMAVHILTKRGYTLESPECCVVQLIKRMKQDETFPHEVGLFLGYPPSDVKCFMEHPCEGVQCCGYWKAFSDPEKARITFSKFRRCTEAYLKLYKNGKPLDQLAVSITRPMAG